MNTVERRHFNELVKILKQDIKKWKVFHEALLIDPVEIYSTSQKLLKNTIQPSDAYRDVLDAWKENSGRDCTFGVLDSVLRSLDWEDAAGMNSIKVCMYLYLFIPIFQRKLKKNIGTKILEKVIRLQYKVVQKKNKSFILGHCNHFPIYLYTACGNPVGLRNIYKNKLKSYFSF